MDATKEIISALYYLTLKTLTLPENFPILLSSKVQLL